LQVLHWQFFFFLLDQQWHPSFQGAWQELCYWLGNGIHT
jgi:hypothetical protein